MYILISLYIDRQNVSVLFAALIIYKFYIRLHI